MSGEPIQIHIAPDLTPYSKHANELLEGREATGVAVGGFIFADPSDRTPRILLVQREKRDGSLAGKWEVPGGGCEQSDPTILHSLAREVFEEAGLHLTRVVRRIGDDQYFKTRSGKTVTKFSFEIGVQEIDGQVEAQDVRVELSSEHQDHAWATQAEVEADKYPMTHAEQRTRILTAFALRNGAKA